MNYRLIVHYENTGIVTIQQFADLRTVSTITGYLDNARALSLLMKSSNGAILEELKPLTITEM